MDRERVLKILSDAGINCRVCGFEWATDPMEVSTDEKA